MRLFLKKHSKKAGLPPGTLVHIGESRREPVEITCINYHQTNFEEQNLNEFEARDFTGTLWVNMTGVHHMDHVENIGKIFKLHPLLLEDVVNTDQRPKVEDYENHIYLVLKMLTYNHQNNRIESEQVSLVLGKNYVLSFQETKGDVFELIRHRLRNHKGRIRRENADYLMYVLVDAVVDNYFSLLEQLEEQLEDIEERLFEQPTPATLHEIHQIKQELIFLRKNVRPLRDVVGRLSKEETPFIIGKTRLYLRDVFDHLSHAVETIEALREVAISMIDLYLSSTSYKMNEVMKTLTIIATIFIPLTFIVGIYGMNFEYIPELKWRMGYGMVWGVMGGISLIMMIYFKRKKWW